MDNIREALIGLFVLFGVALGVSTLVLFGRFHPFRHDLLAEVVFEGSVSGLGVGAPVDFRGVRVGTVTSIAIEPDPKTGETYIPVKLRINQERVTFPKGMASAPADIRQLVAQGMRARLLPISLISQDSEVELDFRPSTPIRLHQDIAELPEIPVSAAGGGSVAQQLSELPLRDLALEMTQTMHSIRGLSDAVSADLPRLLDSTVSTSEKAGRTLDSARVAIEQIQARLGVTLTGIDRVTASANEELNGRGADLHALLVSTNQTMAQARGALANLQELTDRGSPTRANLETSLNDLSAAASSLRSLALDLEQNPRLLLTGRGR